MITETHYEWELQQEVPIAATLWDIIPKQAAEGGQPMSTLSPADQIMIAVDHVYQAHGDDPPTRAVAAAVLAAAADQVVPVDRRSRRQCNIRSGFLAIAAELGGQQP
jgi:hypothetical protein